MAVFKIVSEKNRRRLAWALYIGGFLLLVIYSIARETNYLLYSGIAFAIAFALVYVPKFITEYKNSGPIMK